MAPDASEPFTRLVQKVALIRQRGLPPAIDQETALQAIRQALPSNGWVELSAPGGPVDYSVALHARGCYEIRDRAGRPIANLGPDVPIIGIDAAAIIVRRLVHLARYNAVRQVSNPDPRSPLAQQLEVELLGRYAQYNPVAPFAPGQSLAGPGQALTLQIGEWTGLRIKNCSSERLHITVFDLQPDWGISQVYPDGAGSDAVAFAPGEEQILPLQASLPQGYSEGVDVLKVFAITEPSALRWLELPALEASPQPGIGTVGRSPQNVLEQLMAGFAAERPPTRHMRLNPHPGPSWVTEQVEVAVRHASIAPHQLRPEQPITTDRVLVFNGIDGDTGGYALPPMSVMNLVRAIRGEVAPENLTELRARAQQTAAGLRGLKEGVNPRDLAESGWGVIFPTYPVSDPDRGTKEHTIAAIREALQPLLQLRGRDTRGRLAEWVQGRGKEFRVGADTKSSYLARHGVGPGPVEPDKVPYYLLIVGSPSDIPYRFQTQLDVQYAVGRIHFATVEEYAHYAASVVAAETAGARRPRAITFFGVANDDDTATRRSASELIIPLADRLRVARPSWRIQATPPAQATKAALAGLLGGAQTPALLFTASHGMQFSNGSPRQLSHQGALLCQDWPGPEQWRQAIPQEFYFAGDDLPASADLQGLIAFFFACYGAGTPQFNEFARKDHPGAATPSRAMIAPQPFLAHLPVAMLGRPRGALAVVGHIERAWSYSFTWGRAGAQTGVFENTLIRLLDGHPLGSALEFFNQRYAELSAMLSDELEAIDGGKGYDPFDLAEMWAANNDARGYAIIGDPAVRLPVGQAG